MPRTGRRRMLVIDDERTVRALLCQLLERLGYAADSAEDGAAGLALHERQPFDLVIIDLRIPGMSGWEVLAALRAATPGIPVILISGLVTDESRERAQQFGVAVLQKPFSLATLEQAITRALGTRSVPRKPLAKGGAPEAGGRHPKEGPAAR